MRVIVGFLLAFLMSSMSCFAKQNIPSKVSFIYINGSNSNTKEMKDWFFKGVHKMHPQVKKAFDKDEFVQQNLLFNSQTTINEKPLRFFWGDKSFEEVKVLDEDLQFTSLVSTKIAQSVRKLIGHSFHDAIWVQKEFNMRPVLAELHQLVRSEWEQGHQVILFGYSAGSFITYQYLFQKLPDMNPEELFNTMPLSEQETASIKSSNAKNTCIDALIASGLVTLSAEGKLVALKTSTPLIDKYKSLDAYTDNVCIIPGSIKGIVNFASPIPLFYSSVADQESPLNKYNWAMYRYVIENGIFWLTVNFREDPLGYPSTRNLTFDQMENLSGLAFSNHTGFFYDRSDVRSGRTFITAHLAYWKESKRFAKAVVEAYKHGYLHNYKAKENSN